MGRKKKDYSKIKEAIREIREKHKDISRRKALDILRHEMGYEIRDQKFYELAKEVWFEQVYICAKRVSITFKRDWKTRHFRISPTDYTEAQVLRMLREYEFEEDTAYDKIKVDNWKSSKKEDKQYRLTIRRLMAIYVIILKNAQVISIENLLEITKQLIIDFYDERVTRKKTHLDFLTKVLIILEDKEKELKERWV